MALPSALRSLIFDLDGTLTDSRAGILGCLEGALRAFDIPWSGSLEWFIGPPAGESFERLLPDGTPSHRREVLQLYRQCYRDRGWRENAVYPGVREMLTALRSAGCRLYLCTSKRDEFARRILDHFDLTHFFAGVAADSGTSEHHDKADLLRELVQEHEIEKSSCAMVGDRRFDIEAAHANQLASMGVLYGFGTESELRAVSPDALFDTVDTLAAEVLRRAADSPRGATGV